MDNTIKNILKEYRGFGAPKSPFPDFIRQQLKKVYEPKGMWGKIEDPTNNCITNFGVIGGKYEHIPNVDHWSIVNRFDTNSKVKKEIINIFTEQNPDQSPTDANLMNWMSSDDVIFDLFDEDGEYIEKLVNLNRETIDKGNENELFGIEVLKQNFGLTPSKVKRYCTGSVEDTKQGKDIAFEINKKWYFVQIKPYEKIKNIVDEFGDTYFEISPVYFKAERYSQKNVNFFLFVNGADYIMFQNYKQRMRSVGSTTMRFYEPPVISNVEVPVTQARIRNKDIKDTQAEFGMSDDKKTLENLLFKKAEIEKLIEKTKKKMGM